MAKLKGIESFIFVLIAAFIILGILYLISPLVPPEIEPAVNFTELGSFSLGLVGGVAEIPAKTIFLGSFTAGKPQTETLKAVPKIELMASWFGGRTKKYIINVPAWYMDLSPGVMLTFDVTNTNQYGDLIIEWNGKDFYKARASTRAYKIEIGSEYIEEQNTLELSCEGPGAFFWASTIYDLEQFKVELEYGPAKLVPFELSQSELQSFSKGTVDFYASDSGKLIIKVNGQTIYEKKAAGISQAQFGFSPNLKLGPNILSFEVQETRTGIKLLDTVLRIYLVAGEIVRTRSFNVTAGKLNALHQGTVKGVISYQVEQIARPGILSIKLNDRDLSVLSPTEGLNTVYFGSEQITEGENELVFSATGSFDISDVKVGLERL